MLIAQTVTPQTFAQAANAIDLRFPSGNCLSLGAAQLLHAITENRTGHGGLKADATGVSDLKEATTELHSSVFRWTGTGRSGTLLADAEHDGENLRYILSRAFASALDEPLAWAMVSYRAALTFESRYALRMFAYLKLTAPAEAETTAELSIDELRTILGVPENKLTEWKNLKAFALDTALKQIDQSATVQATATPIKLGRKVVGVTITHGPKDTASPQDNTKGRVTQQAQAEAMTTRLQREKLANALTKAALS